MNCMPHTTKIPPHFSIMRSNKTIICVKEDYKEFIADIISPPLVSEAGNQDSFQIKQGRGRYPTIPIKKNGGERLIVRNYKHGGMLGRLLGNVFFFGDRPLNEIYVHEVARKNGITSAEAIAVTKKKRWGIFYSANFISKEIAGAVDLIDFLNEQPAVDVHSKKSVIFTLAKLIRKMHDAGIYHADLHLKNMLLKKISGGTFEAYIIDLDKSTVWRQLTIGKRMKNLLRLDRSLEKYYWLQGKKTEKPLSHVSKTDRIRFFKAYMTTDPAIDRDWKVYIHRYYSPYTFHKFWWHFSGLS
ncbi:putative KDO kinase (2-keto-3-deoxy-D-manno-octulosonic acid) [Candidatus Kuenenia stuttgartiensis]|uniref:Putative KDO kinase (2-keto-3-deoxy-D-manno-octulosonic acid) n=2 Tax=Candidatus Brocadiaceae TaxID=1127830 RepID=Q1Q7B1_KUEST|nr:hypothetical protein [Candidatus Kuenenia stuttgartiensis]QII12050.1 putative KDO kinase (2-keto-3-deoxy-D-manno-octulosonic acid) [Candidatus Kuenenia stuttgartiensis]CAJ73471.1 similar to KDO kinase (2-keto-3-deoxy-D-manno-octulosonic acid) [Candidatus Kuenenia stuttgartiensis]SOH06405.1 hypothetical protein KSMBR1_3933 [Candidatus Kuenenia stuttgartiensis]